MPIDFSLYMNSTVNGIFLFGVMTLLLTITYIMGIDEIDDFDELTQWKGPTMWVPPQNKPDSENRE